MATCYEYWRPVAWHEKKYYVSDKGRLRTTRHLEKVYPQKGVRRYFHKKVNSGEPVSTRIDHDGHVRAWIIRGHKHELRYVYKIVAMAFVSHCPPTGHEWYHIDGDTTNCAASNIGVRPIPKTRTGSISHPGESNPSSKLTSIEVIRMREMYASGKYTMQQLADEFGLWLGSTYRIIHGLKWKHLPGAIKQEY